MKEVITRQKYKCDFCKKRGIKTAMMNHEKICWRNPNRFCDLCKNTGKTLVAGGGEDPEYYDDCFYCSKRDPEIEKGIAQYEAELKGVPAPQKH